MKTLEEAITAVPETTAAQIAHVIQAVEKPTPEEIIGSMDKRALRAFIRLLEAEMAARGISEE